MSDDDIVKQYNVAIPVSRDMTEDLRSLQTMNDGLQEMMREAYEDMFNPREGPRRRRVFKFWENEIQVSPEVDEWRDTVISLIESSDECNWDDIPSYQRDLIGYWDWEYFRISRWH